MGWVAAILDWVMAHLSRLPVLRTMHGRKVLAVRQRDAAWATLMSKTPWFDELLDRDMLADLPEPARRFLSYAIPTEAPLRTVAVVATTAAGAEAHTIIAAPHGWIRRRYAGLVSEVSGICGTEQLEQRWWGMLVPLAARDKDMAERATMETVLWVPTALCGSSVRWTSIDEHTAQLTLNWTDRVVLLTLRVAESGELTSISGEHCTVLPRNFTIMGGLRVPTVVQFGDETIAMRQIRLVQPYKGHSHA